MSQPENLCHKQNTEIKDSDIDSDFEHDLPPIVIPLERVKLESEGIELNDYLLEDFNSANGPSSFDSNTEETQMDSHLKLVTDSLRCPICKVPAFSKLFFVSSHILRHYDIKLYHCADCDKRFSCNSQLVSHQQKQHNATKSNRIVHRNDPEAQRKARTCPICDIIFNERKKFASHTIKHHLKSLTKLEIIRLRQQLTVQKKRPPKNIQCCFCQIQFLTIPQLAKHLIQKHRHQVVKTILRIKCEFADCQKKFSNRLRMQRHIRLFHSVQYPSISNLCSPSTLTTAVACDFMGCEQQVSNKSLRKHQRTVHGLEFPKKDSLPLNVGCDYVDCELKFSTKQKMRSHFKERHGLNGTVYECPRCEPKSAFRANKLTVMCRHLIDQHSALITTDCNKPVSNQNDYGWCPYCQCISFDSSGHFTRHILGHFNARFFKCDICSEKFYAQCHLKKHKTLSEQFKCLQQKAEQQAIQFFEKAAQRQYFCPMSNSWLTHLKAVKQEATSSAVISAVCFPGDKRVSFYDHSNDQNTLKHVTVKCFKLKNVSRQNTAESSEANFIDQLSCPMCRMILPFEMLVRHLDPKEKNKLFPAQIAPYGKRNHPDTSKFNVVTVLARPIVKSPTAANVPAGSLPITLSDPLVTAANVPADSLPITLSDPLVTAANVPAGSLPITLSDPLVTAQSIIKPNSNQPVLATKFIAAKNGKSSQSVSIHQAPHLAAVARRPTSPQLFPSTLNIAIRPRPSNLLAPTYPNPSPSAGFSLSSRPFLLQTTTSQDIHAVKHISTTSNQLYRVVQARQLQEQVPIRTMEQSVGLQTWTRSTT